MKDSSGCISIHGARVNNLRNVSLDIPRGKIVVVTGVSGSGKSSLAFDTLFAEGQRRFAQSLSAYTRQFLGRMTKPDVDLIEGIPPAVAISQGVKTRNPRSTVGTTTEIYDRLRLLYAKIGRTYSPVSGCEVRCHDLRDVCEAIGSCSGGVYILADLGYALRSDRTELFISLVGEGFTRIFDGSNILRIEEVMQGGEDNYPENAWLLIDRVKIPVHADQDSDKSSFDCLDADLRTRIMDSASSAFARGGDTVDIFEVDSERMQHFSRRFEADGITFLRPQEYIFSYNSPLGACPKCGGLGLVEGISEDLVIPDKSLSIYDKCIAPFRGEKMGWYNQQIILNAARYDIPIFEPYCKLSKKVRDILWKGAHGESEQTTIYGINEVFEYLESKKYKIQNKYMIARYSGRTTCPECEGCRLRPEALYVKIAGRNIAELLDMTVCELRAFLSGLELASWEREIAWRPLMEIDERLQCLEDVGLGYLTLSRASNTLSGGESQRIALVSALGNSLVGSMYVLDEPSIGLHSRDTHRLIGVLKKLRDLGNTIVVVEHDEDIIRQADYLVDIGPKAGIHGGEIVFHGSLHPEEPSLEQKETSLTLSYIYGLRKQFVRTPRSPKGFIRIEGAMHHNLKNITVDFPLGVLTVVTGVSGSGKSSLVGDILYPALQRHFQQTGPVPGTFKALSGDLGMVSKVEYIDQSALGRSSRSNPATYLKVYDDIRKLFASQQYAVINGFTPAYFSFNAEGGRCPECEGEGVIHVGMQFMSDITMVCEECGGKRFKPDVLQVKFEGMSIAEVLDMSVDEAISFFSSSKDSSARRIAQKLQPLQQVGLGYIRLGQSSSTLSGGESQRVKLAYYLSTADAVKAPILFIFDEPTTGLHFYDVEKLLKAFDLLLDRGHSIVVVEHNADVIRSAGWVIDLGPEAGDEGGNLVYSGTVQGLSLCPDSITARYI